MAGCMTILQVWIYYHFAVLERHSLVGGYEECNPRASLCVPIQSKELLILIWLICVKNLTTLRKKK
ncbi:hypothetical protein MKW92_040120 [Papaver armeniacum]|nr:hypothetical protein MKW92_040120 [Papaver armeniacum]